MNNYALGQTVILRCAFRNSSGDDADPSSLTVKIKDPLGTVTTFTFGVNPELIKDATGKFHIARGSNLQGVYDVEWVGLLDTHTAVAKDRFRVAESYFD